MMALGRVEIQIGRRRPGYLLVRQGQHRHRCRHDQRRGAGPVRHLRRSRGTGAHDHSGRPVAGSAGAGTPDCLPPVASAALSPAFGIEVEDKGQSPFLERVAVRPIRDVRRRHRRPCSRQDVRRKIMSRAGEALGLAIAGATDLINPAAIVIGGRIGGLAATCSTRPDSSCRRAAMPFTGHRVITIDSSATAYTAGVFGAAHTVIDGPPSGMYLAQLASRPLDTHRLRRTVRPGLTGAAAARARVGPPKEKQHDEHGVVGEASSTAETLTGWAPPPTRQTGRRGRFGPQVTKSPPGYPSIERRPAGSPTRRSGPWK